MAQLRATTLYLCINNFQILKLSFLKLIEYLERGGRWIKLRRIGTPNVQHIAVYATQLDNIPRSPTFQGLFGSIPILRPNLCFSIYTLILEILDLNNRTTPHHGQCRFSILYRHTIPIPEKG